MTVARKKLIEVALPLDAINKACVREKSIRHGHPSTLHLWWARRPLAAARAVIFSQMVDDPSEYVDVLVSDPKKKRRAETELKKRRTAWEKATALADKAERAGISGPTPGPEPDLREILAEQERKRLFGIIEELVKWENTTNERVLQTARAEIWQSWRRACAENVENPRAKELFDRDKLPAFHDPFAGGGALPLEAQRLGLEAHASDLNPVAVLINKAMIEIPQKFAGRPPVNPDASREKTVLAQQWRGAAGLAEDVRFYGKWVRDEAEKRIGHLYPKIVVTPEMTKDRPDLEPYVGRELTVIAWLWARTVTSPNPAFSSVAVPLVSTFMLSTKRGKETYIEPVVEWDEYRFTIRVRRPADPAAAKAGTKLSRGANFRCLMSNTPIESDHIYAEANAGRMGARLMAIVAKGDRGRIYLPPTPEMSEVARAAKPVWKPELEMPENPRWFSPPRYGLKTYGDLFTPRQLLALTTLSELVAKVREHVCRDSLGAGLGHDNGLLQDGGTGSNAYAEAVTVYLAMAVSRMTDYGCSITTWANNPQMEIARNAFARQAIPMTWDFAETNVFGPSSGSFDILLGWIVKVLGRVPEYSTAYAVQADAATQVISSEKVVSTDPPYYDNIGYADLSDFFYVWLRRILKPIFPDLFATFAVPKMEELVATPYRHGGRVQAEAFFMSGMTRAMNRLAEQAHPAFPVTVYYAFKQSEHEGEAGTASTGWETFLEAVIVAGFAISGTWPMRTERAGRTIGIGTNALASSIILVCCHRAAGAPIASRREFLQALKAELPGAVAHLQNSNIAPVDLAQAAIGPGMAVYTRHARVLESDGSLLSVRTALALINQVLDEVLAEQEGDLDADSRWALAWFEQSGFDEGDYGIAETLSKAKNTSVSGLVDAGVLASRGGKVRLLSPSDLPEGWDPATDSRLIVWEMVHHLIRVLESEGESAAAELAAKVSSQAETARELAYRLYALCERKKRAAEALSYNALVQSWPEITRLAREGGELSDQPIPFEQE